MKVEKSNFYIREILRHLLEGEVQSTNDIAKWINLSEKATRNKISAVDFFLKVLYNMSQLAYEERTSGGVQKRRNFL